jgi:2-haloacid dehalogenase
LTTSLFGGLEGIVFDAYGTLFDVRALERACEQVAKDPTALSQLWRAKQLEYSFLRTAIDRYADFGQITSDALDYASTALRVEIDPTQRSQLMRAWLSLPAFPDVPEVLARLDRGGVRMAILSNGTRQMLDSLVETADLRRYFVEILSSEQVQTFKPDPNIYSLAPDLLHARKFELLFVTANGFDVAGAKSFGFVVCRVNRFGLPMDHLGFEPDLTVQDLGELADRLLGP